MKIHTTHFDGNLEDLGIEVGSMFQDEYHNSLSALKQHSVVLPEFYHPFLRGVSEVTDIPIADIGGIMLGARHTPSGRIWCLKGHTLVARYRLEPSDHLQVFYGLLDGKPFGYVSLFPHPPGTLAGLNRGGISWAARVPRQYNPVHPGGYYYAGELVNLGQNDWPQIHQMQLQTQVTLASPVLHQLIMHQEEYEPKADPTPVARACELFEDAEDDLDLLLLFEGKTRHMTIRRGGGGEVTYDILTQ